MLNEKFESLMQDQEFINELISKETMEEAKEMFISKGVNITEEELLVVGRLLEKIAEKAQEIMEEKVKLAQEELSAITGGISNEKLGKFVGGVVGALTVGSFISRYTLPVGAAAGAGSSGLIGAGIGSLIGGADSAAVGGVAGGCTGGAVGAVAGGAMGVGTGALVGAKIGEKVVKWLDK